MRLTLILLAAQRVHGNIWDILRASSHNINKGSTVQPPKTQTPFTRDGIIKDESSADFEDSYFPWQFKDANWGSGGRARFEVEGESSGRYAIWDGSDLAEHSQHNKPKSPPDFSTFKSGKSQIKNGWSRSYCFNMDVIPLSQSSKLTISISWFKLNSEKVEARRLLSVIYTESECPITNSTSIAQNPKSKCVPMTDDQNNPIKTNINLGPAKPLGASVQIELKIHSGTKVAIDNLEFVDCSEEFDIKKVKTTLPPHWGPQLVDTRYGTYWNPNQEDILKYNKKMQTRKSTSKSTPSVSETVRPTKSSTKVVTVTKPTLFKMPNAPNSMLSPQPTSRMSTRITSEHTQKPTQKPTQKLTQNTAQIVIQEDFVRTTIDSLSISKSTIKPTVSLPRKWSLPPETTEFDIQKFVKPGDQQTVENEKEFPVKKKDKAAKSFNRRTSSTTSIIFSSFLLVLCLL